MNLLKLAALAITVALAASPAAAGEGAPGHSHGDKYAYGEPGDPKAEAPTITIRMDEKDDGRMVFEPSSLEIRRGDQVRFVFENHGELDHEFVLGTTADIEEHAELMRKFPEMEHDDPNSQHVDAGSKEDLVWRFTNAGAFDFACLIPGHMEMGMVGKINVH